MVEKNASTLAPKRPVQDALEPLTSPPLAPTVSSERKVLFDSIGQDDIQSSDESGTSKFAAFFAGLLWFGYAIAIVVALVLVWSAANGLLKSLPR